MKLGGIVGGTRGIKQEAPIGETVRRHVDDAHQLGKLAQLPGCRWEAPGEERRPLRQ